MRTLAAYSSPLLCLLHTHTCHPLLPCPEMEPNDEDSCSRQSISVSSSLNNISRIKTFFRCFIVFVNFRQFRGRVRCGEGQEVQIFLLETCTEYLSFFALQAGISKLPLECQKSSYCLTKVQIQHAGNL